MDLLGDKATEIILCYTGKYTNFQKKKKTNKKKKKKKKRKKGNIKIKKKKKKNKQKKTGSIVHVLAIMA